MPACSAWSVVLSSNHIWKRLYEREWGLEPPDCTYKEAYKNKVVWLTRQLAINKNRSAVVGSLISHGGKVISGTQGVHLNDTLIATEGSEVMLP